MSTILDALRKLQRDRESQQVSRDLREAVTGEIPQSESQPRRGLLPWLLMVLLVGAGGPGERKRCSCSIPHGGCSPVAALTARAPLEAAMLAPESSRA